MVPWASEKEWGGRSLKMCPSTSKPSYLVFLPSEVCLGGAVYALHLEQECVGYLPPFLGTLDGTFVASF